MRIWLRSLGALWLCLLCSLKAVAGQTSVLIVIQRNSPPEVTTCEQQLRSELLAEGYDPSTVQVPETPSASLLVDTAKQLSSPAAISINLRAGVVSGLVWIVDPDEPGGLLRTIVDQPATAETPVVFAVKATNVLQGALLELGYVPPKLAVAATTALPDSTPPPVPQSSPRELEQKPEQARPLPGAPLPGAKEPHLRRDKSRQRRHEWQQAIGADALVPLTNPAVIAFGANLALTRRLGQAWALGLEGQAYLPSEAQGRSANATLYQFMAGARLDYRQYVGTSLTIYESFVTGIHFAMAKGEASAASRLENEQPYAYTLYHQLGLGGIWHATADFGVWARTGCFVSWKQSNIIVVDEQVATVAGPAMLLGLGMQLSF